MADSRENEARGMIDWLLLPRVWECLSSGLHRFLMDCQSQQHELILTTINKASHSTQCYQPSRKDRISIRPVVHKVVEKGNYPHAGEHTTFSGSPPHTEVLVMSFTIGSASTANCGALNPMCRDLFGDFTLALDHW
jgi:hypothetical protein